MSLLGLMTTEQFVSDRFTNIRRQVFYFYPNGAAPLTGLLSLMRDEATNDPEFSWFEKRLVQQSSTTAAQANGHGPFLNSAGGDLLDQQTLALDGNYQIVVADNTQFRTGHQVKVRAVTQNAAATTSDIVFVVTTNPQSTPGVIAVRLLANAAITLIDNGTGKNTGNEVWVVGSTFSQGSYDITQEIYNLPQNVGNYTQIFRTPFSMTGTAIKTGAKYDETGPYKDKAKEHSVFHMIEMEKAFLFSIQRKVVLQDGLPQYTTSGILNFLVNWEGGNVYGNTAAVLDSDDNKRIITNASGTMNEKTYDKYLERVFRVTNNMANEKLVLCGSGFLSVINQMYRSKTVLTHAQGSPSTYGMTVVQHDTSFGTIYYKSHPLFSQNPTLRYNAMFCDVPNMRYRYVEGRDTELLKNRQPNDADYRKDEWLTECGFELRFPESFMYLQNVTDYVP